MNLQTAKELDRILDRFKMHGGMYITDTPFRNEEWSLYPELYIKKLDEMGYIKLRDPNTFRAGGNQYVTTLEGFMSDRFEDILIKDKSKIKTEKTNRVVLLIFTALASVGTFGLLGLEGYKYYASDNLSRLELSHKSLEQQNQQLKESISLLSEKEQISRSYYNELLVLKDSLTTNKKSAKK